MSNLRYFFLSILLLRVFLTASFAETPSGPLLQRVETLQPESAALVPTPTDEKVPTISAAGVISKSEGSNSTDPKSQEVGDLYPVIEQPAIPRMVTNDSSGLPFLPVNPRLPPGVSSFCHGMSPVPLAFNQVPEVTPVPTRLERSLQVELKSNEKEDDQLIPQWQAVFEQSAHFPRSYFNIAGRKEIRPAAILYEGMTVAVTEGGHYEVRFVVESPRTPLVVRLQFIVYIQGQAYCPPQPCGTITLPPITICPEPTESSHPTKAWSVSHRGWSPVLAKTTGRDAARYTIQRTATARFGSEPDFDFFKAEIR